MSQPQPSSLQHWRVRQTEVGADRALREAAIEVDRLVDELGRKLDRRFAKDFALVALGFIGAIVLCVVHGCTAMGHQKVEGWPKLEVIERYVPHAEMRDRCVKYAPFGTAPEACSEFNLEARTCTIYYSADFPPPAFFVKHERMHCEGYDHLGETNMRDFLAQYLKGAK